MKFVLLILTLVFSAIQAGICYMWTGTEEDITGSFSSFMNSFYGEIPAWTIAAFSFGEWWYLGAAACVVIAISALFTTSPKILLLVSLVFSVISVGFMAYAMYPLHLMLTKSVI